MASILGMPEQVARSGYYDASADLARAKAEAERDPRAAYEQAAKLEKIKKSKTPEEIDKLKADTDRAVAAGKLDEQRSTEIKRLLDEKEKAERLGNELRVKQINEFLSVLLPSAGGGFEEGIMRAKDLIPLLQEQYKTPPDDLAERKFRVQQEQTAVDIEKIALEKPTGKEALSRYQDFNRYTNRPKVAINDNGKIKFIDLGKVGGKTITGKQVHDAAAEFGMTVDELYRNAKKAGMTILDYLKLLVDQRAQPREQSRQQIQ